VNRKTVIPTSSSCSAVGRRFGLMTRTYFKKLWKLTLLKLYIQHKLLYLYVLAISWQSAYM